MRSAAIAVLLLAAFCEASPRFHLNPQPKSGSESASAYIIEGEDAKLGEFPWQLDLQVYFEARAKWVHHCGASLLSSRYALSAAYCIYGIPVDILRVVAGVVDRTSPNGVIAHVASYEWPESYKWPRNMPEKNDIAILTLASPIYANGDNIQYATLPDNNDGLFAGRSGFISGWGQTEAKHYESPLILQKARIGVIDTDTCNKKIKIFDEATVDDTQICLYDDAPFTTQARTCNGDSGGPFHLENKQGQIIVAGVASWSPLGLWNKCIRSRWSAVVYTRVSAHLEWIKTHTP